MRGNVFGLEWLLWSRAIIPLALVFFMARIYDGWFRICPSNWNVSSKRPAAILPCLVHHGISSTLNRAWHLVSAQ